MANEIVGIGIILAVPLIPIVCGQMLKDKKMAILLGVMPTVGVFLAVLSLMWGTPVFNVWMRKALPFYLVLIGIAAAEGWFSSQSRTQRGKKKRIQYLSIAGILYAVWIVFFLAAGVS